MVIRNTLSRFINSDGQELVEFAMTLPILALLVFGIFDLGRVVYYFSAMQNSAREGARYGVVIYGVELLPGEEDPEVRVISRTKERTIGIAPSELNVTVNSDCDYVKVNVGYIFDPIIPFIGNININTSSHLQRERWLAGIGQVDEYCTPGL
jgi:hypothetical protein